MKVVTVNRCQMCDVHPQEIRVTATDLDGVVLDSQRVCRPCAKKYYSTLIVGEAQPVVNADVVRQSVNAVRVGVPAVTPNADALMFIANTQARDAYLLLDATGALAARNAFNKATPFSFQQLKAALHNARLRDGVVVWDVRNRCVRSTVAR